MGVETKIQWTDHTFSPWWGCTKVSPGCDHCYAETWAKRTGHRVWGKGARRRVFGDKHWREPIKWNALAEKEGRRRRVFCSSMADVFDAEAPEGQLEKLWALIQATPNLDWQLLTKRHGRIARSLPADWGEGYPNVWLGVSVEDQRRADERIPVLLSIPAKVRFLSCEPLLGPVDLGLAWRSWNAGLDHSGANPTHILGPDLDAKVLGPMECECGYNSLGIDWVIIGGESGHGARPFDINWARGIVAQCGAAGVACFVKQLGADPFDSAYDGNNVMGPVIGLKDPKGGNPDEWPEHLRVREFPDEVRHA